VAAWIGVVLWVTGVLPVVMRGSTASHGTRQLAHLFAQRVEGLLSPSWSLRSSPCGSPRQSKRSYKGERPRPNLSLRKIAANLVRRLPPLLGLLFAKSAGGHST